MSESVETQTKLLATHRGIVNVCRASADGELVVTGSSDWTAVVRKKSDDGGYEEELFALNHYGVSAFLD